MLKHSDFADFETIIADFETQSLQILKLKACHEAKITGLGRASRLSPTAPCAA